MARFAGFPLDLAGFQLDSLQSTNPSPPRPWRWARRRAEPTHVCVEAQGDACWDWPSVSGQVGGCWVRQREGNSHLFFLPWMNVVGFLPLPNLTPSHSPWIKSPIAFLSQSFKISVEKRFKLFKLRIKSCFISRSFPPPHPLSSWEP